MKVLSFGSLNMDYVYRVKDFVRPGETISCFSRTSVCGGKGLNQSIAMARCGVKVSHAGNVGRGEDGEALLSALMQSGVDTSLVRKHDALGGHTVIQISDSGENSILLYGGTNLMVDEAQVEAALRSFGPYDLLTSQNEINMLPLIMQKAHDKGMVIAFNPSPINQNVFELPLHLADILFVNEIEAQALSGAGEGEEVLSALCRRYPGAMIVETLGRQGALVYKDGRVYRQSAFPVKAVDTTGAGDTFMGYFLGAWMEGKDIPACMHLAAKASAICVSRLGASVAIPLRQEVEKAVF
jgi:ribokinase